VAKPLFLRELARSIFFSDGAADIIFFVSAAALTSYSFHSRWAIVAFFPKSRWRKGPSLTAAGSVFLPGQEDALLPSFFGGTNLPVEAEVSPLRFITIGQSCLPANA